MQIYDFPRSSASYRVRICCALKGLDFEKINVDFRQDAQRSADYLQVAPSGLVPTLVDDEITLSQSLAIMLYLDGKYPEPRLVPTDPLLAARAWELALIVACDIHPVNNLRVLKYLENEIDQDEESRNQWYAHWVSAGFEALEAKVSDTGPYCMGSDLSIADLCLVPQMFNARRFNVDLAPFPRLQAIDAELLENPAFSGTAP